MSTSPTPQCNVKSMISLFENHQVPVRRTKSMFEVSSKRSSRIHSSKSQQIENLDLFQIEQQIEHLKDNLLHNYKTYSRDSHIQYQNQIIFIFSDLINIAVQNNNELVQRKSELAEILKSLNKKLNNHLPSASLINAPKKCGTQAIIPPQPVQYMREKKNESRPQSIQELPVKSTELLEEKKDEINPVSVKSLAQMFEKNSNSSEVKSFGFGASKVSRKYLTFNGSADFKYVPFTTKWKENIAIKKQVSVESTIESINNSSETNGFVKNEEDSASNFEDSSSDHLDDDNASPIY